MIRKWSEQWSEHGEETDLEIGRNVVGNNLDVWPTKKRSRGYLRRICVCLFRHLRSPIIYDHNPWRFPNRPTCEHSPYMWSLHVESPHMITKGVKVSYNQLDVHQLFHEPTTCTPTFPWNSRHPTSYCFKSSRFTGTQIFRLAGATFGNIFVDRHRAGAQHSGVQKRRPQRLSYLGVG